MNKIVYIGDVGEPSRKHAGRTVAAKVFARITFDKGRLSICGVVGPTSDGDALGACGQINPVEVKTFAEGWDQALLDKFNWIWHDWHLNDMRPYCEHQKALGWPEKAGIKAKLYSFRLNYEAHRKHEEITRYIQDCAMLNDTATLSDKDKKILSLFAKDQWIKIHLPEMPEDLREFYEPDTHYKTKTHVEEKTLGWLKQEEHPDGILCQPCPTCGYKYGTAWLKEEVPADVIEFLESLPESKVTPAWC